MTLVWWCCCCFRTGCVLCSSWTIVLYVCTSLVFAFVFSRVKSKSRLTIWAVLCPFAYINATYIPGVRLVILKNNRDIFTSKSSKENASAGERMLFCVPPDRTYSARKWQEAFGKDNRQNDGLFFRGTAREVHTEWDEEGLVFVFETWSWSSSGTDFVYFVCWRGVDGASNLNPNPKARPLLVAVCSRDRF